jgi:signal peptide peptidase SppA
MTISQSKLEILRQLPWAGERLANRIEGAPTVGVLRLAGIIGQLGPSRRSGLNLADLATPIDRVFKLPRLKAVALAINSPGGAPVQAELIARRLRQLSDEKEIPVFAFCEDVAASGGYWFACAAEEIYAMPASIVGSIGVISANFGFQALLERIGVERRVHTSGDKKSMLDPFQAEEVEDVARLEDIQEDIHEQFKDYVRDRRGARLKAADEVLFEGEFWTGRRALELGLVDGLGDLRGVMREKFGEKVNLKLVGGPKRFGLSRLLGGSRAEWPAEILDDISGALEARALWGRFGL